MSFAIDRKWVAIIGQHVDQFKWTTNDVANFRCPVCGDSQTNQTKARGYMVPVDQTYIYKCHNCGVSYKLCTFLKHVFPALYDEYKIESFEGQFGSGGNDNKLPDVAPAQPTPVAYPTDIKKSTPLTGLDSDHRAAQYLTGRGLPASKWNTLHFTDDFRQTVTETTRNSRYKRLPRDERIILPLRNQKGQLIGLQGRRIADGKAPKYITIKTDPDAPKIFGLDTVDLTKPVIVVEGPLDSLFLPNAIAICGGDVTHSIKSLGAPKIYAALDNERRNPDTISRMATALELGCHVVFWDMPSDLNDINDMVNAYGTRFVIKHILNHAHTGEMGRLELAQWKRTRGTKSRMRSR